jgi:hypothetical protein
VRSGRCLKQIELRRSELGGPAVDNLKGTQLRDLLNVLCDQEDLSLRIKDPDLLDGVVQILRQLAVMEEEEGQ